MAVIAGGIDSSPVSETVAIGPGASDQPINYAAISGAGANVNLAAAVANKRIRVLSLYLVVTTTAVAITFQSGQGGTALSGAFTLTAGTPLVLPWNPHGWFETLAANTLLNIAQSGTSQISGGYTFQYIDGTND